MSKEKSSTSRGSKLPSAVVYRRRYLDLTWKSVRRDNESKYCFTSSRLTRQRRQVEERRKRVTNDSKPEKISMDVSSCVQTDQHCSQELLPKESATDIDLPPVPNMEDLVDSHPTTYADLQPLTEMNSGNGSCSIDVTDYEMYAYEVKTNNAISLCDSTLKSFVLQDFCLQTKSLKPRNFVFVSRAGKTICDKVSWVYWCSCDTRRSELIESICDHVDTTYDEAMKNFPECLHITIVRNIAEENIDGMYGISPQLDFEAHSLSKTYVAKYNAPSISTEESYSDIIPIGNSDAICVKTSDNKIPMGIVMPTECGPACISCKYQKYTCDHVQCVKKLCEDPGSTVDIPNMTLYRSIKCPVADRAVQNKPTLISSKKIPFKLGFSITNTISTPFSVRFKVNQDGVCQLNEDPTTPCVVCGHVNWSSECEKIRDTVIITQNKIILKAIVQSRKCKHHLCTGTLEFEGQSMGLLVMKSYCIAYEVMRHHMHHFLFGRTTIYTQYKVLAEDHGDAGNEVFSSLLTYNRYLFGWYSFLCLLDIDYHDGFTCRKCGSEPEVVIMDATSLAFRKDLHNWQPFLNTTASDVRRKAGR